LRHRSLCRYDVGGDGACLKRYTDPSSFRTGSACPTTLLQEGTRDERRPLRAVVINKISCPKKRERLRPTELNVGNKFFFEKKTFFPHSCRRSGLTFRMLRFSDPPMQPTIYPSTFPLTIWFVFFCMLSSLLAYSKNVILSISVDWRPVHRLELWMKCPQTADDSSAAS
jgi:hypothetical protein